MLQLRGLLGDGLVVDEYTGLTSRVEGATRFTVVHSRSVPIATVPTFGVMRVQ